jgi:hypothetical protein
MKYLALAFMCLNFTSCASLGGSVVGALVRPVVTIESRTVNETKHETKIVHHNNFNIEIKNSKELAQVPEIGMGEKKVYFYPAP